MGIFGPPQSIKCGSMGWKWQAPFDLPGNSYYIELLETFIKSTWRYVAFIIAALNEHKIYLPYFKNIEHLLKLDETFNQDHVTALRT